MSFLAPGFAIFTALFVVPIAIHLYGRSRARVRRFAALELLLRSERKVARRTKLRQLLLLALRALAIAVVPLILAKPFVETESDLPAAVGTSQSAVIVLDDSLSMSRKLEGTRLLELGRARARRIVESLGRDAEAAIVLGSRGGATPVGELTADRARLLKAIAEVRPSYRATDLSGALKKAAQILQTGARPEKRVYLISDLQARGFDRDPPWAAGQGPEVEPVDVGGAQPANRAVSELKVEPAPQLGPRGVKITVEIANVGPAAKEVPVTLRVDGKPVAKGLVDLPPNGSAQKRFFHSFERGAQDSGVHDLSAELQPDALPEDDRRFQRVEVRRDVKVLLVDGDPRTIRREDELFYLETALRPGDRDDSQLDVSTVAADELGAKRLADFDVVFLANVKAPADAGPLREYVEHGGGLFLSAGDNVDPDAWDASLGKLLPQPLHEVRQSDAGEHLGRVDRAHPVLAPLELGRPHGDDALSAARFTRYLLLEPTAQEPERQVLLHFESGAPALVAKQVGAGRVMLFTSSLDRDWGDLPIQPIFLPLMQQSARWLARAPMHEPEAPVLVGQRHDLALPDGVERVEVLLPSGKTRLFERDRVGGRKALGFTETDEPGVYRVAMAGSEHEQPKPRPLATFAVNVDPAESDVTRIAPEKLAQLTAGASGSARAPRAPRRKVELWHTLGALLLALLLGEALLLRRK